MLRFVSLVLVLLAGCEPSPEGPLPHAYRPPLPTRPSQTGRFGDLALGREDLFIAEREGGGLWSIMLRADGIAKWRADGACGPSDQSGQFELTAAERASADAWEADTARVASSAQRQLIVGEEDGDGWIVASRDHGGAYHILESGDRNQDRFERQLERDKVLAEPLVWMRERIGVATRPTCERLRREEVERFRAARRARRSGRPRP